MSRATYYLRFDLEDVLRMYKMYQGPCIKLSRTPVISHIYRVPNSNNGGLTDHVPSPKHFVKCPVFVPPSTVGRGERAIVLKPVGGTLLSRVLQLPDLFRGFVQICSIFRGAEAARAGLEGWPGDGVQRMNFGRRKPREYPEMHINIQARSMAVDPKD